MTDFNKHNPYPYLATIRCPDCSDPVEFRKAFALIGHHPSTERMSRWGFWESRMWPSAEACDWHGQERWRPSDPSPSWRGWIVLMHDPALFRWTPPQGGYRGTDDGIVMCAACGGRRTHRLRWPQDAYWRFELPQGELWAWDRASALALIDFIDAKERHPSTFGVHWLFLRHIPSKFLGAKVRDVVVRRLQREFERLDRCL